MKADQLNRARNPLLPAVMVAIQRAARRARQVARQTRTAIVVARAGRIERILVDEVRETTADYNAESETGEENQSPSPSGGRGVGERVRREQLLNHAKTLRSNQTEAEQRLWYHLRAKRFMELKFKRQKPIGPFIADFVCLERKLVIEADGGQHGGTDDQGRDNWFVAHGFKVLRFWNHEILGETESVLERIREVVVQPSPPAPLPSK